MENRALLRQKRALMKCWGGIFGEKFSNFISFLDPGI
jgi:predicted sulfurtransferase